jgi:arginine decarboxylase
LSTPPNLSARHPSTWSIADAAETYQVEAWSGGYFHVGPRGHVVVTPSGSEGRAVDLHDLVVDLQRRGLQLPVLVRFSEILEHRLRMLNSAFNSAIQEYGYEGSYRTVYPIKVNQQCDILEELLELGRPWRMGLEAGSKPELLVALAFLDQPDGVIVCNGFKDADYIETALLAQELGRHPILVIDRFEEFELIIRISKKLDIVPHIGLRARLASKGAGRWNETGGEKSKFGLSASEIVMVVNGLRRVDMLGCLELLHFHIGSQITEIRAIKEALRESARFFVELHKMGAAPKFLDVGGGLGVDYDGSKNRSPSSINYTLQEYANDVVDAVQQVCEEAQVPHPQILSESGRALSAYHSVLIFDVLGANQIQPMNPPTSSSDSDVQTIRSLFETWQGVTADNFRESYHDALQLKEEAQNLFNLGFLNLEGRSEAEDLFWAVCLRTRHFAKQLEFPPPDFAGLERALADTYFCNFSIFQSVPDSWAIDQIFPVMPIHRLDERPTRVGTLADLTCDSDGKISKFVNRGIEKSALELHALNGRPYYIAMFLVGAYQETLGDLHNLFGDTTAVHVTLDDEHGYSVNNVVEGDTVNEVLAYVQYDKRDLLRRVRRATEDAVRRGALEMERSAWILRRFEEGLTGYTYLSREDGAKYDTEDETETSL